MFKRKMEVFGVIVGILFSISCPAWAQSEVQQLNQKINVLDNRIQQLQGQLLNSRSSTVNAPKPGSDYPWEPFLQMQNMQQQMNNLMDQWLSAEGMNMVGVNVTKIHIQQTPSLYLITMNIPLIRKDQISVEVKGRTLVISGNHSKEIQQNSKGSIHKESSVEYFMQSVLLPQDAVPDKITARCHNDKLTVSIPLKKELRKKNDHLMKIVVR